MASWRDEALCRGLLSVKLSSVEVGGSLKWVVLSEWFGTKVLRRTERRIIRTSALGQPRRLPGDSDSHDGKTMRSMGCLLLCLGLGWKVVWHCKCRNDKVFVWFMLLPVNATICKTNLSNLLCLSSSCLYYIISLSMPDMGSSSCINGTTSMSRVERIQIWHRNPPRTRIGKFPRWLIQSLALPPSLTLPLSPSSPSSPTLLPSLTLPSLLAPETSTVRKAQVRSRTVFVHILAVALLPSPSFQHEETLAAFD